MKMRITFISDSHNKHNLLNGFLPGGDLLIHAGDISSRGYTHEIENFAKWYDKIDNYDSKVFICGNHDFGFQDDAEKVGARITGGTAIGKNYDTLILDMGYQTADIYINIEDGTIELYGEPADSFPQFKEAFMDKVTRDEIEKDENQFRREQGLEETLLERVFNRIKNDQSRTKR